MFNTHTTRKTAFILVLNIILIIIFLDILYIGITLIGELFEKTTSESLKTIIEYDTTASLILTFIQIVLVIFVTMKWANQSYNIKDGFITYFSGIFFRKQEKVNISNIDGVSHAQSLFGKIIGYGDIKIEYGRNQVLIIQDIPYPEEFIKYIEDVRTSNNN